MFGQLRSVDATLGDESVRAFLRDANPLAAGAIARVFDRAQARGFWASRRNSTGAILAEVMGEPDREVLR